LSGWGGSPENNRFLNSDVNPAFKYPFNMYTTLGSSPPTDFYQPTSPDKADFYLFVIESDASAVSYASYFGGPLSMEHVDGGTSRFDRKGKIYQAMCAGCGGHTDMPIKPPFGATELPAHNNSSNCNIGVFKMDFLLPAIVADFNGNDVCLGDTTHFTSNSLKRSATDFLWKFGDGATSTLENPWHLYSSGGTYNVTLILSDSTSCNLADTIVKPVYISPLSTANATADDSIICKGDQTTLRATPNSTAFLYSWTPASGLSNPQSAVTTAMPTVTTTYTVLIYDKKLNNCQASDTVTIKIQAVVADFSASDVCLGNTVYFTSNSSKLQATTFLWKFGDGATSTMENPSHLYNQPGTYNVTLIVSDPASCNGADTLVKPLYVSPISSSYSIDATADDYTIYKGKQTVLRAIPNTPGFSYSWTPTTGLSNPQSAVTVARPQITTTYTVAVSDPKLSSCRVGDTVTIQVIEIICREPYIYVPNAFTPNEDGKNELIYVRSKNVRDLYFTIYNRWGEKVFETKDQNIGWDGTYKGMKVDPGVFDYYVEGHCIDDQQFFMKGNITVIR
jgi:gliding motility-associated-like protein